jgi:DNA-binding FrmR family transcriptional regulator
MGRLVRPSFKRKFMGQHQHTDKIIEDIEKTIEHLSLVKKMIVDHQSCVSVLNQIAGVFVRLNATRSTIVQDHIKSCITSEALKDPTKMQAEIEQILKATLSGPPTGSFH